MHHEIRHDPYLGRLLWLTDGKTDIAATLDVGIRIIHLSVHQMENLYYVQPEDLSDGICTPGGWKLIGGHRFWLAPEGDNSYWPDQKPVEYELEENAVTLTQCVDPWLGVQKSIRLEFLPDGAIAVRQSIVNVENETFTGALWGVNTLRGGTGQVPFADLEGDPCVPHRAVQLWGQTSLGDPRIRFTKDRVYTQQMAIDGYFKIGFYSSAGRIHHENLGQSFDITFPVVSQDQCPDGQCNVEIFQHSHVMELEVLGPVVTLNKGESASIHETWRVNKLN